MAKSNGYSTMTSCIFLEKICIKSNMEDTIELTYNGEIFLIVGLISCFILWNATEGARKA